MGQSEVASAVSRFYAALRANDVDAWVSLFAADATARDPVGTPPHRGRDGLRDFLSGVLRQFEFDGLEGRLDKILAPTVVLWGEEDRWVPLGVGRALAAGITRSALVSVPRAGHSVQEEAPDEVNHLLIKFLRDGLPRIPQDLALAR